MKSLILIAFLLISIQLTAQNVGIGTNTPHASAKLHIEDANRGFLVPRVSLIDITDVITPVNAPITGLLVYNTNAAVVGGSGTGFYYWNGTQWTKIDANTQNTLDQAYDEGGPGVGRVIDATDGAVRINGEDGFIVTGTYMSGDVIETTGAGTRMFFNPRTAAFRAGGVDGTQWDPANVGDYSVAFGYGTTASGIAAMAIGGICQATDDQAFATGYDSRATANSAVAMGGYSRASSFSAFAVGYDARASENSAVAMGGFTRATGVSSFAMGYQSEANNHSAVAMGYQCIANSHSSFAAGRGNTAASLREAVFGSYATTYVPAGGTTAWNINDRIFSIGNGQTAGSRSNALTIFKDGRMNINDAYTMPNADGTANQVLTTNGAGVVAWQSPISIGATNGLSLVANNIELGGNLTHGTTVNCNGSALTFEDASGDYGFNITNGVNTFALMYGDNSSVWCGNNELRIRTTDIGTTAAVGQILRLTNATTGEVRYTPYSLPAADGTTGQVLTTDGAGNASWQNAASTAWDLTGNAGTNPATNFVGTTDAADLAFRVNNVRAGLLDDGGQTLLGYQAGLNNTGLDNTFVGYQAGMDNTTARQQVAVGYQALENNTTGWRNVAIGYRSLRNNTGVPFGGAENVAVGQEALMNNLNGYQNTAVGAVALRSNTRANANTAVGYFALRNQSFDNGGNIYNAYNTAFGYNVLASNNPTANSNGIYNTGLGARALEDNTQGVGNTGSGYRATRNLTTGDYNVSNGFEAGEGVITGDRNVLIGYHANVSTGALVNATAIGADAVVDADNKVRVGATTVTSIGGQVGWTTFSDKRFKNNVKSDVKGLDFIMKLNPVSYTFNPEAIDKFHNVADSAIQIKNYKAIANKRFVGFMAQDVAKIAKETGFDFSGVDTPLNSSESTYGIRYAEFVVPLTKAVQEQQQEIELLKKQNIQLQKENQEIQNLKKELEEIKTMLQNR